MNLSLFFKTEMH